MTEIQKDNKNIANVPHLRFPGFTEEWEVKKFSEYIKLFRGSSPRPIVNFVTKDKNGVNWIKIGDTKNANNSIINNVEEKITIEGARKSRKVTSGELILANSMSFGKVYQLSIDGCIYDGWFVLREYENYFEKSFLLQLLNSDYLQKQYKRLSAGGIVQNISSEVVYETILIRPSFQEQQKISSFLSLIDERIQTQIKIIEELKLLKNTLRYQLYEQVLNQENEIVQIKKVINYEQPTKYLVSNTDYSSDNSLIPVLTANKAFVLGYTAEGFGIYDKGECIIFDDFTMDTKFVDFPFKVKSSAIKILTAKSNVNLKFVFEYLSFLGLSSVEHKRHYISEIEPIKISLPYHHKQNQIANILSGIDKKVKMESDIYTLLTKQKLYLLQNLFI